MGKKGPFQETQIELRSQRIMKIQISGISASVSTRVNSGGNTGAVPENAEIQNKLGSR